MRRNVNLPTALLSRFDLIFIILDRPDQDNDMALARHVTYVHQYEKHPTLESNPVPREVMQAYIQAAQACEPYVPEELTNYIVEPYVSLRTEEARAAATGTAMLTARQLLSIMRLAQAHARLRLADTVEEQDVDEAMRLLHSSKASILAEATEGGRDEDSIMSRIYEVLRDLALSTESHTVKVSTFQDVCTRKGYKPDQVQRTIEEYEKLEVIRRSANGQRITFVN